MTNWTGVERKMNKIPGGYDTSAIWERVQQGIRLDKTQEIKVKAIDDPPGVKAARVKAMKESEAQMAAALRASEQRARETGVQENKEINLPNINGLTLASANTVKGLVELMIQNNEDTGMQVNAHYGDKHSNSLNQYLNWIDEYIDSDAASYTPTPAPAQKTKPE